MARGQSGNFDHLAAYDQRIFGVFSYDALGTCHFRLGNYAKSREYYDLAAQHNPDQLEYRVKRALSDRLARQPAGVPA